MEYLSEVVFGDDLDELSMNVLFDKFLKFDGTRSVNLEEFSSVRNYYRLSIPSMFERDFELRLNKVRYISELQKNNHIIPITP